MKVPFADLKLQYESIKTEIDNAIFNCINTNTFIGGEPVKKFENEFADFCKSQFCIGCGNGTDALEISLKALGLKPGDEVIVPAVSFIATSEAVTNAAGRVVFCDIDKYTYNIDATKIESLLTSKTKGIIPVHLYGQMADMTVLKHLAKKHGLFMVEDSAQAHGATFNNMPPGYYSDATIFSFYPGKNLGAYGDAGAIITNSENIFTRAKMATNHGRMSKYNHEFEGRSSRLDSLQASILSIKLKHLLSWSNLRKNHATYYHDRLKNNEALTIPYQHPDASSVFHLYVIKVSSDIRDKLREYLAKKGINTGIHYPDALPYLPAYKHLNHNKNDFPVAFKHVKQVISLPMFPEMTSEQLEYVCDCIEKFFS